MFRKYWEGVKKRLNNLAGDIEQSEISAIPGPIAEFIVLHMPEDWIDYHQLALKMVRRPASIFINILFPNEGFGRLMTQLNSDFWVAFEKTWQRKLKDDNYLPDRELDFGAWQEKSDQLIANIKEKAGKLGDLIAEWYEGGKLEEWVEAFKSWVEEARELSPNEIKTQLLNKATEAKEKIKNELMTVFQKIDDFRDEINDKFDTVSYWNNH